MHDPLGLHGIYLNFKNRLISSQRSECSCRLFDETYGRAWDTRVHKCVELHLGDVP